MWDAAFKSNKMIRHEINWSRFYGLGFRVGHAFNTMIYTMKAFVETQPSKVMKWQLTQSMGLEFRVWGLGFGV